MNVDATTTPQDNLDADAQFVDAFHEMTGTPPAAGAEEATGELPEAADVDAQALPAAEDVQQPQAEVVEQPGADGGEGGIDVQAAVDAQSNDAPATAAPGSQDRADDLKKQEQRLKSWEGRLKAHARAQGLPEDPDDPAYAGGVKDEPMDTAEGQALQDVAKAAEANGDNTMADVVEDLAEKVDDAEITPDEARRILAEDFGEPFLRLIDVLTRSAAVEHAGQAIGEFQKTSTAQIDAIKNSYLRNHFKQIQRAHGDFQEVSQAPEFQEFLAADPERQQVAASGDAMDVIELIDQFKKQANKMEPQAEAVATPAADQDGAEAVRATGGINLPAVPTKDESYESAWESF